MRTRLLLAAALALLGGPALATCDGDRFLDRITPAERAALDATVAATPFAKGLIWEATQNDKTLYVVGTMHIHDPRLNDLFAQVTPLMGGLDLILLEATPEEEAAMQAAILETPELMFITDGPTLPEQLDDATWQALADAAAARMIPPFMAAKMQPWYLSLTLAIPPCAMPDLMAGQRGLDHMIMGEAQARNIAMQAVEPWSTLIDVMQSGSAAQQLEMLELSLLTPALQSEMFVSMLEAYFAGDVVTIFEASRLAINYTPGLDPARGAQLFAETEQTILIDRNHNWMPVITDATDAHQSVMLAVGAAHLPGQDGVLNLLERAGWTISPIR